MKTVDYRSAVREALNSMAELNDVIQDTHGNVSAITPTGTIYIKPSGMKYNEVRNSDVCRIKPDGEQALCGHSKNRKASVDTSHHIAIYKARPHIKAICHTHSPYATAYAYNHKSIRCLGTEQADFFGEDIECLSYSDLNNWGAEVGKYIHNSARAMLLARHGVLTFGDTPEQAVKLAVAVENCARKNYLAETLFNNDSRRKLDILPSTEVNKWHERYYSTYGQK